MSCVFEAPPREGPQDEGIFLMPLATYLMLRNGPAQPGRVSKHARRRRSAFLPSLCAHPLYGCKPIARRLSSARASAGRCERD